MAKLEKITFHADGGEPVDFYVLEQTRIGGVNYILVTDTEEGDGDALILKDMSGDGEEESVFAKLLPYVAEFMFHGDEDFREFFHVNCVILE